GRGGGRRVAPEPAQGARQNCTTVLTGVATVAPDRLVVVLLEFEGRFHLQVAEIPVPGRIVEVVRAILEEHADRLLRRLADDAWIAVAAADVGETADVAEDLAEQVRPFPRHRERADAPGRGAANTAARGVLAQLELLADFRQNFLLQELGV